ncbi:SLAC1 anion channel family protein [Roseospira visakhapatnamensis]|uniref:Tellurite resistance protein n=1 Tax=Roseospira visakhapatnamensis TaxID=390880 RepID=A0A7W6RAM9_9PROT|nr:SLAC1 anion channel family protein [Roseospira visakhapatnamensis]MBB4264999.1 tellurite resistance protein [Roseospira visakhapatnamensis]
MTQSSMPAGAAAPQPDHTQKVGSPWLMHVPIPLFALVMGTAGLGIAWRKAHHVLGVPAPIGEAILALAAACFAIILVLYAAKWVVHADEVRAEFNHPVRSSFFPALSISLFLLAVAAEPYSVSLMFGLWATGTLLHLLFTLRLLGRWIVHNHQITHSNPAWFIPIVGNLLVPLAGVRLGYIEISWFFFAIGMVFWVVLFTVVFYRIVFHDQMPAKFIPTLFILIAPPAIGFLSYELLNGGAIDAFSRILIYVALFITLLNFTLVRQYLRVPFFVSWWAYTFPLAAMSVAAMEFHRLNGYDEMGIICAGLLTVTTLVIVTVFARTLMALIQGKLFIPD